MDHNSAPPGDLNDRLLREARTNNLHHLLLHVPVIVTLIALAAAVQGDVAETRVLMAQLDRLQQSTKTMNAKVDRLLERVPATRK
jgi:outer membrane murein-binding lipoprotein Lpp